MKSCQELRKFKSQMKRNPTAAECEIMAKLREAGIRYTPQCILGFYIADIAVPSRCCVIEVDGSHHENAEQVAYDSRRSDFLRKVGLSILRVPNSEAETWTVDKLLALPAAEEKAWRSCLAKASSFRGVAIRQQQSGSLSRRR